VLHEGCSILILITIDELYGSYSNSIANITGDIVYNLNNDKDIPFNKIDIMITYGSKKDWELLEKLPNLKWIQVFQTGIESAPLKIIESKDITLTNVRDIYGAPMSEYAMSLILYQVREIGRFVKNKKYKIYDRTKLVDEANKKTLGIFGTGLIGKELAKKAQSFDMKVIGFNTSGKPVQFFDETYTWDKKNFMISKCDFIVLLLPLTQDTYHLFSEKEFEIMKENAYLINIGRGPLVKEKELVDALNTKKIKGAALDVFDEEPLPEDSLLWQAENLIITPHLSGKTKYFFERCITIFQENYQYYKKGKPLKFSVDFTKGY